MAAVYLVWEGSPIGYKSLRGVYATASLAEAALIECERQSAGWDKPPRYFMTGEHVYENEHVPRR